MVCDTVESLRKKFSRPEIIISISDNENAQRVLEILNSLDFVSVCELDGRTISVMLEEDKQSSLLRILIEKGVEVEEIRRVKRTLEDIYFKIVQKEEEK